jgi:hypothetical protein
LGGILTVSQALSGNHISEAWTANYNGIFRANIYGSAGKRRHRYDAVLRKRLEAEAKFLRAFLHFDTVRVQGECR